MSKAVMFVRCPSCGIQCSVVDGKMRTHKGTGGGVCHWSGKSSTEAAQANSSKARRGQ